MDDFIVLYFQLYPGFELMQICDYNYTQFVNY